MKSKIEKLKNIIDQNRCFVLASHVHTDGDALGSLIAFYHYLNELGKEAYLFVPGDIPEKYEYLGTNQLINRGNRREHIRLIGKADVFLVLDISSTARLDIYYEAFKKCSAIKICIDHHPIKDDEYDMKIVDSEKVATAEIIYDIFRKWGKDISKPMAEALYSAILSDSGSFRFQGTSAHTMDMAARLIEAGADPVQIYAHIFESATIKQLRAWGDALTRMRSDGLFAWISIRQEWLEERRLSLEEVNGLINIMRQDRKNSVFAVFVEKNAHEIMVGLRSKNGINVGRLARQMGGGGHFHAAGFTANKPIDEVVEETIKLVASLSKDGSKK